jgi:DinB superfamily
MRESRDGRLHIAVCLAESPWAVRVGTPAMTTPDSVFQRALSNMLTEIFDGPPGQAAYVLNPGDPGLLRQLDTIDANTASKRPMPGKTTIAAHIDHVQFGLRILNRWAAGEANPWAGADGNASWQRTSVTEEQWRSLRDALRDDAEQWREAVAARASWDDMAAAAALSTVAHTAYHVGAIRQILAGLQPGR